MIDEKFLAELGAERLGDMMCEVVQGPCYKVPSIPNPNSHLYCCWSISDLEALDMTVQWLIAQYVGPAMDSLAAHMNGEDVCLVTSLPCTTRNLIYQECYKDQAVPIRLSVAYSETVFDGEGGFLFSMDLMADLLTKPEIK